MLEIRDIHEPFCRWLDKRGVPYHRSRSDKRTTGHNGDPDFIICWMGHCLHIECKVPGNKLGPEQERRIAYLRRSGNKVVVAYSLQECIDAAQNILCEEELSGGVESKDGDLSPRHARDRDGGTGTDCIGDQPSRSGSSAPPAQPFFHVANVLGTDYVMARDRDGVWCRIRKASPLDLANLPMATA